MMVLLMSIIVTPFGVVAAIYLREYAKQGFITRLVTNFGKQSGRCAFHCVWRLWTWDFLYIWLAAELMNGFTRKRCRHLHSVRVV